MPDRNHFDRSKPFYPLVMNYLASLHGFKTMMLETALVGNPHAVPCEVGRYIKKPELLDEENTRRFTRLIGPLVLLCKCGEAPVTVGYDFVAKEYGDNLDYLLEQYAKQPGASLLTMAWEITFPYHDTGPLWQFLRHCRNAAAHNGRWHFDPGQPKHVSEWKVFKLEASLQGKPLFNTPKEPGTLSFGDPINLLWDIEQAYPNMKV